MRLALWGMQVRKQFKKWALIWSTFCLQDWKEKYIHSNYTRIFTDNYLEQVCIYTCVSVCLQHTDTDRGGKWDDIMSQQKKIPTSGFTISEYYITVTRAQHEGVIQVYSQWPLFVCQCVCACFIAMSRCVLVRSLFREGLWWTSWGDGALRFMVWRQTPGVYC